VPKKSFVKDVRIKGVTLDEKNILRNNDLCLYWMHDAQKRINAKYLFPPIAPATETAVSVVHKR
jgi:hypothetical protein